MVGLFGGAGVGKTTQLGRLRRVLADEHVIACVMVDYGEFNELSSAPDVTDFLLSVVGGFALQAQREGFLPDSWDKRAIGARMLDILKRLRMPGIEVGLPGRARSWSKTCCARTSRFAGACVSTCRVASARSSQRCAATRRRSRARSSARYDDCAGVALVVDSTEKLVGARLWPGADAGPACATSSSRTATTSRSRRSTRCTSPAVAAGVRRRRGAHDALPVPGRPDRAAGSEGEPDEDGLAIMDEVAAQRACRRSTSSSRPPTARAVPHERRGPARAVSHAADRRGRARRATTLPLGPAIVASAIATIREDYLAVTAEAAPWLARIQETNGLDGLPEEALASLGAYFQAMVVLQFSNGTKWYAIHPLMRERVLRAQRADG